MSDDKLDQFLKQNLSAPPEPPLGEEKRIWLRLKGEELKEKVFRVPLWVRYAVVPVAILVTFGAVRMTLYFVEEGRQPKESVAEILEEHYGAYLDGEDFYPDLNF